MESGWHAERRTGKKSRELDRRIYDFLHPDDSGDEDVPPSILLGTQADLEEAWLAYTMMEASGWKHLPYAGGMLDQPELLMRNIYRIKNITDKTRELPKAQGDVTE